VEPYDQVQTVELDVEMEYMGEVENVIMETRLAVQITAFLIMVIPAIIEYAYLLIVLQSVEITSEQLIKNVIMVGKLAA
jgi:hypothetical protein